MNPDQNTPVRFFFRWSITVVGTAMMAMIAMIVFAVAPVCGQTPPDADLTIPPVSSTPENDAESSELNVKGIQSLLNEVPLASGGPTEPLDVDGRLGPKTKAAIVRFQKVQLGVERAELDSVATSRLLEFKNFKNQLRTGKPVVWGAQVTGPFKTRVLEVCESVELDPDHLMAAMAFESAETFSPAIKNAAGSGATGLIQFMPSTAKGLGTTTEALSKMSAVEQLDYVEKYFKPYQGRCKTLSDVYMAILWPAAIGKPEDHVLFAKATRPKTYEPNKGLDLDHNGEITKREAASMVQTRFEKGEAFRK